MEEKLKTLWAVVWDERGGVHMVQVEELIRRNRLRFLEHKEGEPGGYAVLGFADNFMKAQEGRREMMRLRKEKGGSDGIQQGPDEVK